MAQTNYHIGDFFIQIKNAAMAHRKVVEVRETKLAVAAAESLKDAGYVNTVEVKDGKLKVTLTYQKKQPLLMDLKLVSKPGLRTYIDVDTLKARRSPSMYIISTPKGVLTQKRALKENTGGEVLVEIW